MPATGWLSSRRASPPGSDIILRGYEVTVMSKEKMKAAVFHGHGELRVDEVAVPRPKPDEVLIKVSDCGVCGTDVHIVGGGFPVPHVPLVLGHEFAGEVAEVGAEVEHVGPGDKATADINISCGRCYFCRHNAKMFCPHLRQLGVHTNGAMAEYVVAPAANVYLLPNSLSLEHASYVEPLACVIHGQDRAGIRFGETVTIIGAGSMGLAHAALSRLRGAARVIVSEPNGARRLAAERLGADLIIDPASEDAVERVLEATDGRGADVVVEAVGSIRTYEYALRMVRPAGRLLAFGAAPAEAEIALRPFEIFAKELTIMGSYAGTYETWSEAIDLLANGRFDPGIIIDTVRPLEEAAEMIKSLEEDKSVVKVLLKVRDVS